MEQSKESLKHCPVCGSIKLQKAFKTQDYFLSQEEFNICVCRKCGFHFTNPRPTATALGPYYKSDHYFSHSHTNQGILGVLYQQIRKHTLRKKYELVSGIKDGESILDIGCATGQLLNEFKKRGWHTMGIEPDEKAREYAHQTYDLKVFDEGKLDTLEAQSFDVISMWHVLEHVSDLRKRMEDLRRLIKDNGSLFIALPNLDSWDAHYYQKYWAGLDVPRHLYHFKKENVEMLFDKYGFSMHKMVPMKFDAYYVSLLSEKYKKNPFYLFSAFFRGWYSNLKARKNIPNHSSILYILKPTRV